MTKWFYPKLAATNLTKNRKMYISFLITCISSIAMFYMMTTLWQNESLGTVKAGQILKVVLGFGAVVMGIFSVIFLFYTNSFLVKRRKKEMGLLNILGMEKRHLSIMIFFETVYIGTISIVIGLLLGALLNRMMFQIVWNILQFGNQIQFQQSATALQYTTLLFTIIFGAIYLEQLRQIHLSKPIQLLRGGATGEQEPKSNWVIALLGIVCMCGGYLVANWRTNLMEILSGFFIGVVLVIIGTYCLFVAGSVVFLKQLRKNKKYYYQTKHFISVSTMLYRMKQNAVGLSNICILATMLLVVIASTTSLYFGTNDILDRMFPRSIMISADASKREIAGKINLQVHQTLENFGARAIEPVSLTYLEFVGQMQQDGFTPHHIQQMEMKDSSLYVLTEAVYNQFAKEKITLGEGAVALFSDTPFSGAAFHLLGMGFQPSTLFSGTATNSEASRFLYQPDACYLVVKDTSVLQELSSRQVEALGAESYNDIVEYYFNVDVGKEKELEIYQDLNKQLGQDAYVGGRDEMGIQVRSMYGGLFFVGIFLGFLFLMATVLIIYYKQISEGYNDKARYTIMKKVGLHTSEIKETIQSQVLTVFFFPLVVAGIHVGFAYPALVKLLNLMGLSGNNVLFLYCTIGCYMVFLVLYSVTYGLTAKVYNQIVNMEEV